MRNLSWTFPILLAAIATAQEQNPKAKASGSQEIKKTIGSPKTGVQSKTNPVGEFDTKDEVETSDKFKLDATIPDGKLGKASLASRGTTTTTTKAQSKDGPTNPVIPTPRPPKNHLAPPPKKKDDPLKDTAKPAVIKDRKATVN